MSAIPSKYRIGVIGDPLCGKRAFIQRLLHNHYEKNNCIQLSPEYHYKTELRVAHPYTWTFCVCPSYASMRAITAANLLGVDAVILCCNRSRLTISIDQWIHEYIVFIRESTSSPIFIVYTKSDIDISHTTDTRYLSTLNVQVLGETSAKYGTGFEEILDSIYASFSRQHTIKKKTFSWCDWLYSFYR
jgi:GTPase SAR1 family protein